MKVGAIIVLYNPDEELIGDVIESLLSQVDLVYLVDNSDRASIEASDPKIIYKPLYHNVGIAAAQNIAIKYFIEQNYDFVLFSDQDSVSKQGLVANLLSTYMSLSQSFAISAIGPLPINRKTGTPYIYQQNIIEKCSNGKHPYYKMHSIISSYSLVPVSHFNTVGLMDESLFIDFVEQDWMWRARRFHNMTCVLLPEITIQHESGISKTFLGRQIKFSSAFRIYFQTRNLLWLCRKDYVPSYWKKMNVKKLFPKFIYYSLVPRDRFTYFRRMIKGLYDGIR